MSNTLNENRKNRRTTILAAIIGGVFVLAAAFIGVYYNSNKTSQKQFSLEGSVYDSNTQQPISYADIKIKQRLVSPTQSDAEGYFVMENVSLNKTDHIITVEIRLRGSNNYIPLNIPLPDGFFTLKNINVERVYFDLGKE